MSTKKPDRRLTCRYCGAKTWQRDFARFMFDHDKSDGKRCLAASSAYGGPPTFNRQGKPYKEG
jgi:hypothetical protein